VTTCNEQAMRQRYEIVQPGELFDPVTFRLGAPCKRNHLWDEGVTVRIIKNGQCIECQRTDALERKARLREEDPEALKKRQREATYRHRAKHGRESRSKHGFNHNFLEANGFSNGHASAVAAFLLDGWDIAQIKQRFAIDTALRVLKPSPSVAQLVFNQQQQHWRQHPADYRQYKRERSLRQYHWRYMIDKSFRLYHRSKSKHRKAQQRGSTALMLSPDQLWRRWVQFDHCCAYCGVHGDLHMEHVIPISKGGEHHLGNIVPACQRCNYSKATSEVQAWYRSQPFFDETRWHHIQSLLAQSQPSFQQLVFL
jgi:5-methylcytosine-specific restriction endonuclease McrA